MGFVTANRLPTLVLITSSQARSVVTAKLSPRLMAALFTRMSTPPHSCTSSRVRCFMPKRSVRFDLSRHFGRQVIARVVAKGHIGPFAGEHFTQRRADTARAAG